MKSVEAGKAFASGIIVQWEYDLVTPFGEKKFHAWTMMPSSDLNLNLSVGRGCCLRGSEEEDSL